MRILAADDDAVFRRLLEATLRRHTAHELTLVEDGKKALDLACTPPRPELVILDWMMPEVSGTQVCRTLRALRSRQYVIVVTGRQRREEVLECLRAGADDVLIKPVAPDLLVAKIERARERCAGRAESASLPDALRAAVAQGNGELIVSSAEASARVLVHDGLIAWVAVADGSPGFLQVLIEEEVLDQTTTESLVEECRHRGTSVTDLIVEWGLLERDDLRQRLAAWQRNELERMFALPDARSLFVAQKRRFSGSMAFPAEEVAPNLKRRQVAPTGAPTEELRPSLIPSNCWEEAFVPAPAGGPAVEVLLDRCMAGDGVLGVAAFDPVLGYHLGRRGTALSPDIAWAQLQVINAVHRLEPVLDSVVCTEDHHHLIRMVSGTPSVCLYAVVSAREVLLALARKQLQEASAVPLAGLGPEASPHF